MRESPEIPRLEVEEAVLAALTPGADERYALPRNALPRLRLRLSAAVAGPRAREEVRGLLRLVAALATTLGSPQLAEQLRGLMREDVDVQAVLSSMCRGSRAIDEQRLFLTREGREPAVRAPLHDGSPAPVNLRVIDFINPGQEPRASVRLQPAGRSPGGHYDERKGRRR